MASLLVAAGCGGGSNSKLVGTWTYNQSSGGLTLAESLKLDSSGSASLTVAGSGSCSGTLTNTGLSWSATGTQITFSGTASCSGQVMCTINGQNTTLGCNSMPMVGAEMCSYTLSSDGNMLTLTCAAPDGGSGGPSSLTFTRS